jgi:CheY-like chemotaxis protein
MGGSIVLRSEPGRGSEFRFELTLPPAESTQPVRMSPDLSGLAALIVSATRIEAPMIARQLGHWGAKTCIVADDDAAKALIPERAWDLLIVDRQLGRSVAQDLARTAARAVATRLVLIAPGDRHELPDFKEFGFSGYLIKPVRGQSLAARLAQTEDRTGPEDALATDAFDDLVPCPEPTRGLAVLVAEDNEINALLARSLLTKLGHHPTIAGNGALAVESWLAARACGAPYDLVLMDLHMPEVDGLEAARRIRAVEADSGDVRTPILALTANAFAEDRDTCLKSGMDGFLTKPLDRERLAQALALAKSPPLTPMAA